MSEVGRIRGRGRYGGKEGVRESVGGDWEGER